MVGCSPRWSLWSAQCDPLGRTGEAVFFKSLISLLVLLLNSRRSALRLGEKRLSLAASHTLENLRPAVGSGSVVKKKQISGLVSNRAWRKWRLLKNEEDSEESQWKSRSRGEFVSGKFQGEKLKQTPAWKCCPKVECLFGTAAGLVRPGNKRTKRSSEVLQNNLYSKTIKKNKCTKDRLRRGQAMFQV